ncbi:MAG TPA: hypothetical protein VGM06_12275 [Polyangiaceae bacterium]|jgi:hypothetical protein
MSLRFPFAALAVAAACAGACATAGVDRAYTALDSAGDRRRTAFFTDTQAIYCDVEYSSGRADVTIDVRLRSTALWSDAAQQLVPVAAVFANGEIAGQVGTGNTGGFQWMLASPDGGSAGTQSIPYPVGDFVCDVMLDGETVTSAPFTVRFPACPVPPVAPGVACAGWVQAGSVCADALGDPCTCTNGVWTC